ncbi:MAG: glycosyltransferase [Deltaproteobacteria bacterium]|nr:glycosyltransferase [Deltaproteobacteria bacterium]
MRLLSVMPTTAIGGTERQAFQRYMRYADHGIEVTLFILLREGELSPKYADAGITVLHLKPSLPRLIQTLRRSRFDLVETFGQRGHMIGRTAIQAVRPQPALFSIKVSVDLQWTMLNRLLERATEHWATKHVSNSYAGKHALRSIGISAERIAVVPNGTHIPNDAELEVHAERGRELRSALGISAQAFVILSVANLRAAKDHESLLRGFASAQALQADSALLLAGDGPKREPLEQLARGLGIADRVRFLGVRSDVADLLGAADVFVLPTHWEGMPGAVMEAMAAAVPVIASGVGGVPELIQHERSGFLVSPLAPDEITEALSRLYDQPDLRRSIARQARHDITFFSIDRQVDRWVELYRRSRLLK